MGFHSPRTRFDEPHYSPAPPSDPAPGVYTANTQDGPIKNMVDKGGTIVDLMRSDVSSIVGFN